MRASGWFLCAAIVGLLFTVNALAPRRRLLVLVGPSFFSAWLTNELAIFHLIWQPLVVIAFIAAGALHGWLGYLALPLIAASWGGLVYMVAVALRTGRVMDDALASSIGAGATVESSTGHDGESHAHAHATMSWRRVLLPNPRRKGVERIRDLQYVDDGQRRHRLDIYRPAAPVGAPPLAGAPVLLQIHGGAWTIGNKEQQGLPLMYQLAQHGWVCVAINYRLSPKATWPDHLVDAKQALAWVKEHIAAYGGDPERIVVTGGSAGGHLTAMIGLTANDPAFQPGFERVDTTVAAFVPLYAVYDFTDRGGIRGRRDPLRRMLERRIVKLLRADAPEVFDLASPMSRVREGVPPCLVIHGSLDVLAPVEEARTFAGLLRAASTEPVAYAELPGANHAFDVFPSIRTVQVVDRIERFASWAVSRNGASGPAGSAAGAAASATGPTTTPRTEPSPVRPG